jgi:hypothetical protein
MAVALAVGLALVGSAACAQPPAGTAAGARPALPTHLLPPQAGNLVFQQEQAAEAAYAQAGTSALVGAGMVYSIHQDRAILGSVQIAPFKPQYPATRREVREGVLHGIGSGKFTLTRIGTERVNVLNLPEQRILVWFSPDGRYYDLLVARKDFTQADQLFVSIISYQRGGTTTVGQVSGPEPLDPRRGGDD